MQEVGYRGQLEVTVIDKNGSVFIYDTPNIITYGIRKVAAHALVGELDYAVTRVSVGLGSTPPTRDDTTLEDQVYSENNFSLTYPQLGAPLHEIGQVQFMMTLGLSHPTDGNMLREVGLFTTNGILVARQVHAPVIKTPLNQIKYRWRIVFT